MLGACCMLPIIVPMAIMAKAIFPYLMFRFRVDVRSRPSLFSNPATGGGDHFAITRVLNAIAVGMEMVGCGGADARSREVR
jgi:hypothetical protein